MRSQKVQKRAAKTGFDYPDAAAAFGDLKSEIAELQEAMTQGTCESCAEELGDVLFSAVNVARLLGIDAEEALTGSCEKFIRRFDRVEELARQENILLADQTLDRLNELWDAAKRCEA